MMDVLLLEFVDLRLSKQMKNLNELVDLLVQNENYYWYYLH
jgi:hypothetical protein